MIGLNKSVVTLEKHDNQWKKEYLKEEQFLKSILGNLILDIQHVGSTALTSCYAKPIIDIAVLVENSEAIKEIENRLSSEYICMGDIGIPNDYFVVKGDEEFRTHHIHILKKGAKEYYDHLVFRDFLINNSEYANEYCELKKNLSMKYSNNREKYTKSKDPFIKKILDLAQK